MSRPMMLIYDIPSYQGIPNPSNELREIGFRLNKSCWIIMEGDTPWTLLNDFDNAYDVKVEWHTLRYDICESEKIAKIAVAKLKLEVREAIKSARLSEQRAATELTSETGATLEETVTAHRNRCRLVVTRLRTRLQAARSAAGRFGIGADEIRLADAWNVTNSIQAVMRERAKVYMESVLELQRQVGRNDGMVKAAKMNKVIPGILADYMDEQGLDGLPLRSIFA